jgi:hypothetical protein
MIRHQTIGMAAPFKSLDSTLQDLKKSLAILIIFIDRFFPITPGSALLCDTGFERKTFWMLYYFLC